VKRKIFAGITIYKDKNVQNIYNTGDIIYESSEFSVLPDSINKNLYLELRVNINKYILRMGDIATDVYKGSNYCLSNGQVFMSNTSSLDKLKHNLYKEYGIKVGNVYRYHVEIER